MPRKARSYDKHTPEPDPKYGSVKYAKFINYMMERGKKNVARKIFYDALDIVQEKMKDQLGNPAPVAKPPTDKPVEGQPSVAKAPAPQKAKAMDSRQVFDVALKNVCPLMELKSRRIGGANYQVPMEVRMERKLDLAIKWILDAARSKKGKGMAIKLSEELISAANNEGNAIKKKADTHRMAEANKAFAHFAR